MAGIYDWPPVLAVAGLVIVFAALGVWLFKRRDLGATVSLSGGAGRLGVVGRIAGRAWQVLSGAATGRWSLRARGCVPSVSVCPRLWVGARDWACTDL